MILGLVKAGRWPVVVAGVVVLAAAGAVFRQSLVELPLLAQHVPFRMLVALVAAPLVLMPLYQRFPEVSAAFVRARSQRVLASVVTLTAAAASYAPTAVGADSQEAPVYASLLAVLLTLGVVAVVVVGDYAWLVTLGAGTLALFVDTAGGAPVSRALWSTPPWVVAAMLLGSVVLYCWVGPRRAASSAAVDE